MATPPSRRCPAGPLTIATNGAKGNRRSWPAPSRSRRPLSQGPQAARRYHDRGMALGQNFAGVILAARSGEQWAVAKLYQDLSGAVLSYLRLQATGEAEVLLLRVFAGLTPTEVARLLGKRPVTVRVLQHRALARLAADLAEFDVTTEQLRTM